MCAAWLPHLKAKRAAYLINVSSGLAYVPLTRAPSYCATKVLRGGRKGGRSWVLRINIVLHSREAL